MSDSDSGSKRGPAPFLRKGEGKSVVYKRPNDPKFASKRSVNNFATGTSSSTSEDFTVTQHARPSSASSAGPAIQIFSKPPPNRTAAQSLSSTQRVPVHTAPVSFSSTMSFDDSPIPTAAARSVGVRDSVQIFQKAPIRRPNQPNSASQVPDNRFSGAGEADYDSHSPEDLDSEAALPSDSASIEFDDAAAYGINEGFVPMNASHNAAPSSGRSHSQSQSRAIPSALHHSKSKTKKKVSFSDSTLERLRIKGENVDDDEQDDQDQQEYEVDEDESSALEPERHPADGEEDDYSSTVYMPRHASSHSHSIHRRDVVQHESEENRDGDAAHYNADDYIDAEPEEFETFYDDTEQPEMDFNATKSSKQWENEARNMEQRSQNYQNQNQGKSASEEDQDHEQQHEDELEAESAEISEDVEFEDEYAQIQTSNNGSKGGYAGSQYADEQDEHDHINEADDAEQFEEEESEAPRRSGPPPLSGIVQKYWASATGANQKQKQNRKNAANNGAEKPRSQPPQPQQQQSHGKERPSKEAPSSRPQSSQNARPQPAASASSSDSYSLASLSAVDSQVSQLKDEIAKYQKHSARLSKLNREQEVELKMIREENARSRHRLEEDLKAFEAYKADEQKRIRNAKLELDRERRKLAAEPERKERALMDQLKAQLDGQAAEFKEREDKLKATITALRHQLTSCTGQLSQVKQEKIRLEQERLEFSGMQEKLIKLQKELNQTKKALQEKEREKDKEIEKEKDRAREIEIAREREREFALAREREIAAIREKEKEKAARVAAQVHATPAPAPTAMPAVPIMTSAVHSPSKPAVVSSSIPSSTSSLGPAPDSLTARDILVSELATNDEAIPVVRSVPHPGGKTENFLSDGSRLILFRNGTRKRIYSAGHNRIVFPNGDLKLHYPSSQTTVYYYAAADTVHTSFADGLQVYEFANHQKEKHFPDGTKQIFFPDGSTKVIN